jgi:colanic acid biosynthesis glycosyl transferase WcaI
VTRAEAGICIPPENPSELAKALLTLKNNPELAKQLGRNGRHWAESHHSPQVAAEQFEKLLDRAISKSPRR